MSINYKIILSIIKELGIDYDKIEHDESKSCDDSKKFRDEKGLIGLGSKNIVFSAKGNYYLVTTYGDKNIKARNFKKEFGTKDIRFAYQEEIDNIINSIIGSIPPFGFDNVSIPIYVDSEIFNSEYFIFNPSIPTISIRIKTADLKKIYDNLLNPVKYFTHKDEEFFVSDSLF